MESKSDIERVVVEEEVEIDSGDAWQTLKGMPEPIKPSRSDIQRHNLTHLPYKSWCPHCVAARRNAAPHLIQKNGEQRSVPLLVFDYAFPRAADETETVTCLIGKMYPMRTTFGVVCDQKGRDPHVISRLAAFIRENGVRHIVYKSDQEESISAMAKEAIKQVGIIVRPMILNCTWQSLNTAPLDPVLPMAEPKGQYRSSRILSGPIGLLCSLGWHANFPPIIQSSAGYWSTLLVISIDAPSLLKV